jgi:hypothetical protein
VEIKKAREQREVVAAIVDRAGAMDKEQWKAVDVIAGLTDREQREAVEVIAPLVREQQINGDSHHGYDCHDKAPNVCRTR